MMTEASKAKKIRTQQGKIDELEKKVAALSKLKATQVELDYERTVLRTLEAAPTSDGKTEESTYDGSAEAVAAAESNAPDPSTIAV